MQSKFDVRRAVLLITAGVAGVACPTLRSQEPKISNDRDEIIHVLNRTSFGIQPGDVEAVQKIGLSAYLEQQLHPEMMDDSAVDQDLAKLPYLQLSDAQSEQLYAQFVKERNERTKLAAQQITQAEATQMSAPGTPATAVAPAALPTLNANGNPTDGPLPDEPVARKAELLRRAERYTPNSPPQALMQAKLIRAVESKRQLQEVLVDFWTNHFNVDVSKNDVRVYLIGYDRDVIRPHIWGSFRDLLEATAKSPAMLIYLDNATNVYATKIAATSNPPNRKLRGMNENYGREIMELHTLGVNAGYTQKDVQEVARCFTGWTFDRKTGAFVFRPKFHDEGAKMVLGHVIPANGGLQDGETVMDILTRSPQCAHFISREMCQRFVSDDPPMGLVDRIAGIFQKTSGDLRSVTQAILTSPEFLASSSFGNKIKSPEEFALSAVRASGSMLIPSLHPNLLSAEGPEGADLQRRLVPDKHASSHERGSLQKRIADLGEPLYRCAPPTGYKEVSTTWVNSGALIGRLNFAVALTEQNVNDVAFDAKKTLSGIDLDQPEAVLVQCVSALLQNKISDSTRKVLAEKAVPEAGMSKTVNPGKLIALILGSPEFQRK